jgi:hypothetical protein
MSRKAEKIKFEVARFGVKIAFGQGQDALQTASPILPVFKRSGVNIRQRYQTYLSAKYYLDFARP